MNVSFSNLTHSKISRLPFSRIAGAVLGPNFDLSVVFCGNRLSERLNRRRRRRGPTNVLSFKLSRDSGEIFLNSDKIRREARLFEKTVSHHTLDLYLHGLLHLAGFIHGRKMDQAVHKLRKRFRQKSV